MKLIPFFSFLLITSLIATTPLYAEEGEGGGHSEKKAEGGEGGHGEKKDEHGGGEKSKGPSDVTGGRFAGDPVYVHLAPLVMPVITQNGSEQIVTLLIDIEVKDFDTAETVQTIMPKVRDSIVRNLYGGLSDGDLRKGKLINVNKVKTRAMNAVADVIGRDKLHDVLIQGIAQRVF